MAGINTINESINKHNDSIVDLYNLSSNTNQRINALINTYADSKREQIITNEHRFKAVEDQIGSIKLSLKAYNRDINHIRQEFLTYHSNMKKEITDLKEINSNLTTTNLKLVKKNKTLCENSIVALCIFVMILFIIWMMYSHLSFYYNLADKLIPFFKIN